MRPHLLLREDGFSLEFYSINCRRAPTEHQHAITEMAGNKGYVLQEIIIAPPHMLDQVKQYSVKTMAPERCNLPLIFTGSPGHTVQYASIIAKPQDKKTRVDVRDTAVKITSDGISLLYGSPILSAERDGGSFTAAFNKISEVLQNFSMRETSIARTWLFMNNVLRDYENLNTAREQYFAKWHCPVNQFMPASTGIQGQMIGREALAIQFCAFSGNHVAMKQIPSPMQNEPTAYGKLFSRAVSVDFPHSKLILISGTAAIDKSGASVHAGDFKGQMGFTLKTVSAILDQENGGFDDIAQAIFYLKRRDDMDCCLRILEEKGFPCERALFQLDVDVCREDLLCEMEVTAVMTS